MINNEQVKLAGRFVGENTNKGVGNRDRINSNGTQPGKSRCLKREMFATRYFPRLQEGEIMGQKILLSKK